MYIRLEDYEAIELWNCQIVWGPQTLKCEGDERMSCYLGAEEAGPVTLWAFLGTKFRHLTTSRQISNYNDQ